MLGPAHEDTNKVTYSLAEMLAQNDCMEQADEAMEAMTAAHIKHLGFDLEQTQDHLLYSIELLNGCNRGEDAGGLLARPLSNKQTSICHGHSQSDHHPTPSRDAKKRRGEFAIAHVNSDGLTVAHILETVQGNLTQAYLESGLHMARVHVVAKNPAVEGLLKQLIRQCQRDLRRLLIQNLRATNELLHSYHKTDQKYIKAAEFSDAHMSYRIAWPFSN